MAGTSHERLKCTRRTLVLAGAGAVALAVLVGFVLEQLRKNEPLAVAAEKIARAVRDGDVAALVRYEHPNVLAKTGMKEDNYRRLLEWRSKRIVRARDAGPPTLVYGEDGQILMWSQARDQSSGEVVPFDLQIVRTDDGPKAFVQGALFTDGLFGKHLGRHSSESVLVQRCLVFTEGLAQEAEELRALGMAGAVDQTPDSLLVTWDELEKKFVTHLAREREREKQGPASQPPK